MLRMEESQIKTARQGGTMGSKERICNEIGGGGGMTFNKGKN